MTEAKCKICENDVYEFINFGKMPIANGFLSQDEFSNEYFFEMKVGYCSNCHMVQLLEQPDREKMFNENYAFFSGTSKNMAIHFEQFASHVIKDYLEGQDPFVVEIGSNDGIMLKNFANQGIRHLGIEPSANVADVARRSEINTTTEFFDKNCAQKIVEKNGKADAFLAANVMCHIPYMDSILEGISVLLSERGIVMFEDPYLGDVIKNTTYDQIYDEHVFLFSGLSISYLFEKHGFELIDVEPQETHGGSMRYVIARKGKREVSPRVNDLLKQEKDLGLDKLDTFTRFKKKCEKYRRDLVGIIKKIKDEGHKIVGYAATSKSTTILNYCGLTPDDLDYICDTTLIKQGKFSPGVHIPVKPYEKFKNDHPPYALLFAYNHSKEIMSKETEFMNQGGKWIVYYPEVKVL